MWKNQIRAQGMVSDPGGQEYGADAGMYQETKPGWMGRLRPDYQGSSMLGAGLWPLFTTWLGTVLSKRVTNSKLSFDVKYKEVGMHVI